MNESDEGGGGARGEGVTFLLRAHFLHHYRHPPQNHHPPPLPPFREMSIKSKASVEIHQISRVGLVGTPEKKSAQL